MSEWKELMRSRRAPRLIEIKGGNDLLGGVGHFLGGQRLLEKIQRTEETWECLMASIPGSP